MIVPFEYRGFLTRILFCVLRKLGTHRHKGNKVIRIPTEDSGQHADKNLLSIIQALGHCLATHQVVPISVSFTRDRDIA